MSHDLEARSLAITAVAGLTNWIARMVTCPTCQAEAPLPCFSDGRVHAWRIVAAEDEVPETPSSPETPAPGVEDAPSASRDDGTAEGAPNFFP